MSQLYLILHRVRGEPALDVATQIDVNGEQWWIIPTSGHRAYPVKEWSLTEDVAVVFGVDDYDSVTRTAQTIIDTIEWDEVPDHYASSGPRTGQEVTTDLLSTLGLTQPPKTFLRR